MIEQPNEISSTEDFEFAALQAARNYRAALLHEFSADLTGNVVEVGAGIGQWTESLTLLPSVRRLVSIEPETRFCRTFRQRHPRLALVEGTIDDLEVGPAWDAIVSINVLEHIKEDEAELAKYSRHLAGKQGRLCLFVPARPELYALIDRDFGHYRRYTRPDLRRKLEGAGFTVIRLHYFNWPGYFAWWLNFRALQKRHFTPGSVALFDRFIFPIGNAIERHLVRPPFGQSLLAVAQAKK